MRGAFWAQNLLLRAIKGKSQLRHAHLHLKYEVVCRKYVVLVVKKNEVAHIAKINNSRCWTVWAPYLSMTQSENSLILISSASFSIHRTAG